MFFLEKLKLNRGFKNIFSSWYSYINLICKLISQNDLKTQENILKNLLELLPQIPQHHSPSSPIYKYIEKSSRYSTIQLFGPNHQGEVDLGVIGKIDLPYYSMGSINSTHLFGLDELILSTSVNL